MPDFHVVSSYVPSGDQPEAIDALADGLERGIPEQTLLGVTGSGKTYTMAKVIERVQRPTLVLAHNKTLAAQLLSLIHISFSGSSSANYHNDSWRCCVFNVCRLLVIV